MPKKVKKSAKPRKKPHTLVEKLRGKAERIKKHLKKRKEDLQSAVRLKQIEYVLKKK